MGEFFRQIVIEAGRGLEWIMHAIIALHVGIVFGTVILTATGVRLAWRADADVRLRDRVLLGAAGGAWGGAIAGWMFGVIAQLPDQPTAWPGLLTTGLALGLVEGAMLGPAAVWLAALWIAAWQLRALQATQRRERAGPA